MEVFSKRVEGGGGAAPGAEAAGGGVGAEAGGAWAKAGRTAIAAQAAAERMRARRRAG